MCIVVVNSIGPVGQIGLGQETVRAQSLTRPDQNVQFDESLVTPGFQGLLVQMEEFGIGGKPTIEPLNQ